MKHPVEAETASLSFSDFNLTSRVLAGIPSDFQRPTAIQERAIPAILEGGDLLGCAQTGTGKTAAFVLPMLHRLLESNGGAHPRALILAPTRELAQQIFFSVKSFGAKTGLRAATIYGGVNTAAQIEAIRRGVDIVIACPGRLLDLIGRKAVNLRQLQFLVLDEADQMLDMGFLPPVRKILKEVPNERQTLFFSATMPPEIKKLADEILSNPCRVTIGHSAPAATVSHVIYAVEQAKRTPLLIEILKKSEAGAVLVFARTKHRVKKLGTALSEAGFLAASLQGNLSHQRRQKAINGFRKSKYRVLVATDIASRGIDIDTITHVINYDMPDTVEAYTHRVGRTGRAQRSGEAITFIGHEDEGAVRAVEKVLGAAINRIEMSGYTLKPGNRAAAGRRNAARSRTDRPSSDRFGTEGRSKRLGGARKWRRGSAKAGRGVPGCSQHQQSDRNYR